MTSTVMSGHMFTYKVACLVEGLFVAKIYKVELTV